MKTPKHDKILPPPLSTISQVMEKLKERETCTTNLHSLSVTEWKLLEKNINLRT